MSEPTKDLTYYLTHTDEMPTDPKEIEALANAHMEAAMESGTEPMNVDKIVGKEDVPAPSAAPTEPEAPKAEPVAEPVKAELPEEKPKGILAKDGEHIIPYSQLENARERAKAAEALVTTQAAELERLKAAPGTPVVETQLLTEEELASLETDSPTLAKVLRAQQKTIQELTGTVQALAERSITQEETETAEVKSEIQTAIDAVPTLAEWQTSEDQTMWNKAAAIDRVLREMPDYKDVSFEDRFNKVVELTQSAIQTEKPAAPAPKQELNAEAVKAAAEAKLKAVKPLPRSLSDIPGGAPPAVDERERVEQMSVTELGNKFMNMTPEQMAAYLSQL